jgi:phospholipase/carboxylesterase
VLLHGFGASGDDLVSLADVLDVPARFVFPEAPLELAGVYGDARAWWLLDMAKLEAELQGGPRDRADEVPDGLPAARERVLRLLDQVSTRLGIDASRIVIGGFSQGAMLAVDVAVHRAIAPAGLIVLSGTLVAEAVWQPRLASLAGVPVFQAHGKHDALLAFGAAERLRDRLQTAGARLEWHAFAGGHEIPASVVAALGEWITARA